MSEIPTATLLRDAVRATLGAPQTCLAWSPDGRYLLSGGTDGVVHVLDGPNAHCRDEVEIGSLPGTVSSLAWQRSPASDQFIATHDRQFGIFDRPRSSRSMTNKFRRLVHGDIAGAHAFEVHDADPNPHQQYLLLHEGGVKVVMQQYADSIVKSIGHRTSLTATISQMAWSPDGRRFAVTSSVGGLMAREVPERINHAAAGSTTIVGLRLENDVSRMIEIGACSNAQTLLAWAEHGRVLYMFDPGPSPRLSRFAFEDRLAAVPDTLARTLMCDLRALSADPTADRFAVVGARRLSIAAPADDKLRNVAELCIDLHPGSPVGLAWSPDGSRLAVTGALYPEEEDLPENPQGCVTILTIGPASRGPEPEPPAPDPRYADGAPPDD